MQPEMQSPSRVQAARASTAVMFGNKSTAMLQCTNPKADVKAADGRCHWCAATIGKSDQEILRFFCDLRCAQSLGWFLAARQSAGSPEYISAFTRSRAQERKHVSLTPIRGAA